MRADYLGFTTRLQREHGDITFMRLGRERAWNLFTPELVREALVDHAQHLVRWERGIEVFEQVFGQSVLVTEGATWQRQRRMLQGAFTPRRAAGYAKLMVQATGDCLDAAVPAGQASALLDMGALFTRLTMDVILRTLFSSRASDDAAVTSLASQLLSATARREMFRPLTLPDRLPLPGKAAKRAALRQLRGVAGSHIARRQADPLAPHIDLLAMLLALRDENTGQALNHQEVFDQCMVSFQTGHETSSAALLWSWPRCPGWARA